MSSCVHPGLYRVDEEGNGIAAGLLVEWWPTRAAHAQHVYSRQAELPPQQIAAFVKHEPSGTIAVNEDQPWLLISATVQQVLFKGRV